MTNGDRLTLAELADAVGMTARNVRAYQTRGLLQPPRRVGRSSVYGAEHVQRLRQVHQARARGASLALLQTLIAEGRELEGVWAEHAPQVVDVTDAGLEHTDDCLARRDVPLAAVLSRLAEDGGGELTAAVRALVAAGVFAGGEGEVRVPGAFACAVGALHDQGALATAAAVRLASSLTEAARPVVALVAAAAGSIEGGAPAGAAVDAQGRQAAAARLGELAAAVVGGLATRELLAVGALAGSDGR